MKCLIIKTSSLGDIIQAFPVLEYLKEKFPEVEIDWVVEESCIDLIKTHPMVARAISLDTRTWRKGIFNKENWRKIKAFRNKVRLHEYDYVFDLQSNLKSSFITWMARSKYKVGFGFSTAHEWPSAFFTNRRYNPPIGVNIRDDYLHIVQSCFSDSKSFTGKGVQLKITPDQNLLVEKILSAPELQQQKKLMICPGSAWRNKQLTEGALSSFLDKVHASTNCSFIFVWGSQEECALAKKLQEQFPDHSYVCARLPLPVLQNLMSRLDLVITMDSLPLHLAGSTRTPTFSVFGSSLAEKFKPKGEQHFSLQGACPYGQTFPKRCKILRTCKTGACIRAFSGDDVYQAFIKVKI